MPNFIALTVGENEIKLLFVNLTNSLEIDYRSSGRSSDRQIFRQTDLQTDRSSDRQIFRPTDGNIVR